MKVLVKTVAKEEHVIEVSGPGATVSELKAAAVDKMALEAGGNLTLVHLGKVLSEDSKSLADLGIAEGAMLVAVIKKAKVVPAASAASPSASAASVPDSTPAPPAPASAPTPGSKIRLTVSNIEGDVRVIEVDDNETVENVKAVLEVEFAVPIARQVLMFESKQLQNAQRIDAAGIKNDDMLMMQAMRVPAVRPAGAQGQGGGAGPLSGLDLMGFLGGMGGGAASARPNPHQAHMNEANQLLQMSASDPHFSRRISENNKPLADAIKTGNPEEVAKQLLEIQKIRKENEFKKQQAIMRLNADPFDVEAQKQIEEMVRMENVNENLDQVRRLVRRLLDSFNFPRLSKSASLNPLAPLT
jgi:hypothetical protein